MSRPVVLFVDDKPNFLALFRRVVGAEFEVRTAFDGTEALGVLAEEEVTVVLTDVRMPGVDGVELLRRVKRLYPGTVVILMTAYGAIPDAVTAIKGGAFDYLTKPFDPDDAMAMIRRAVAHHAERLPPSPSPAPPSETSTLESATELAKLPYREALAHSRERLSKEYVVALLKDVQGNVTQAAERAGIERESFHRLLKKHGIRAIDFRVK